MKRFAIRDTVHEWIRFSKAERALINSPLVQRLKWIKQLGAVDQVFNGACHTRFEHSLGAMKIAGKYMKRLLHSNESTWLQAQKEKLIQLARIAALLHDVGHGPYSHSFDHTVYQHVYDMDDGGHDEARHHLIQSPLLAPLICQCGITPAEVSKVWRSAKGEQGIYTVIHAVVEGPLGADRIDFTRRDAHYTGMQHLGTTPYRRIIDNASLVYDEHAEMFRLAYADKCIRDIVRTLNGRLILYHSVYFHKTAMAATLLIELMMQHLSDAFDFRLIATDPARFCQLTDDVILAMALAQAPLLLSSKSLKNDAKLHFHMAQRYQERLKRRELPKLCHEARETQLEKSFDEVAWRKRWHVEDRARYHIIRTRVVADVSPEKFEQYHIRFRTSHGTLNTCAHVLKAIDYQPSCSPYYLVRCYDVLSTT